MGPNNSRLRRISNPYMVLPLDGLVKWGFATAVDVHAAALLAASPEYPSGILPPKMLERFRFAGWSDTEIRARWYLCVSRMADDSYRAARRSSGTGR